jgi:hypothetical protein
MNDNNPMEQPSGISKQEIWVTISVLLVVGILVLTCCIKMDIQSNWLKHDAIVNPDIVKYMRECIQVATFVVMPSLSLLLILSARLIWKLSKKLDKQYSIQ